MTIAKCFPIVLAALLLPAFSAISQKVTISGEAVVGATGDGGALLTLNSERPWAFRQYGVGPSTALELFSTTGLKNFIITTTGNVGIGVLAPNTKLHVAGSITAGPRITFGSAEYIEDGGGFIISCNGALVSTADGTDDLGSSSKRWRTVYASGGLVTTSDRRVKKNVQNIRYGLNEIMKLHPVSFEWKDQPEYGPKLGLLAQEVQQVISEVVVESSFERTEGTSLLKKVPAAVLGINYSDLIPVLIRGMQEQQEQIADRDAHISVLETRMHQLELRLEKMEKLLGAKR